MAKGAGEEEAYDMSYSGLKTAVVNYVKQNGEQFVGKHRRDVCRSFEESAIGVLVEKSERAVSRKNIPTFLLVGGVARNQLLREKMEEMAARNGLRLVVPPPVLCTDNAAMVARAALFRYESDGPSDGRLDAVANAPLPGA